MFYFYCAWFAIRLYGKPTTSTTITVAFNLATNIYTDNIVNSPTKTLKNTWIL